MATRPYGIDDATLAIVAMILGNGLGETSGTMAIVDGEVDHDALLNYAANEHYLQSAIVETGEVATGVWSATKLVAGKVPAHDDLDGFAANVHYLQSAIVAVGTVATGVWSATQLVADKVPDHDNLNNVSAAEHIDWSVTGIEDVHADRIGVGAVTQHVGSIDHDALLNFLSTEHYLQSAITEVGTIDTGLWQGTALAANYVPNHNSLNGYLAAEHIDWAVTGAEDVHVDRIAEGAVTQHEAALSILASQVASGSPTFTFIGAGSATLSGELAMGANKITGLADGEADDDAATVKQVALAQAGISAKPPSHAKTEDDLETITSQTINYSDGSDPVRPGVGSTLDPTTNGAFSSIDNHAIALGETILVDGGAGFVAQVSLITAIADVGGALDGKYFNISAHNDTGDYYVWMNVDSGGNDPTPAGRLPIPVAISTGNTAIEVATAVVTAVDAELNFGAARVGADINITNAFSGRATDIADVDTGFTGISTDTIGKGNEVNGLYELTALGDISNPWELTRIPEFDGDPDSPIHEVREGAFSPILHGDTFAGTSYMVEGGVGELDSDEVGIKAITWTLFTQAISYVAGAGLDEDPAYTFKVGEGTGILVGADTVSVDVGVADGKIPQMGASGYPAAGASLLTALNASALASGLVPLARGGLNASLAGRAIGSFLAMAGDQVSYDEFAQGTSLQALLSAGAAALPVWTSLLLDTHIGDVTATASEINTALEGIDEADVTAAALTELCDGSTTIEHMHEAFGSYDIWTAAQNVADKDLVYMSATGIAIATANALSSSYVLGAATQAFLNGQPAYFNAGTGAHVVANLDAGNGAITQGDNLYLSQDPAKAGQATDITQIDVTPGKIVVKVGQSGSDVSAATGGDVPIMLDVQAPISF